MVIEIKDKLWKTDMLSLYGDSQYIIASANGVNNLSSLMLQHLQLSVLHWWQVFVILSNSNVIEFKFVLNVVGTVC